MTPGSDRGTHTTLLKNLHPGSRGGKGRSSLQPNGAGAKDRNATPGERVAHGPTSFGSSTKKTAVAAR